MMRFGRRALQEMLERVAAVEVCFGAGMQGLQAVTSPLRDQIEL